MKENDVHGDALQSQGPRSTLCLPEDGKDAASIAIAPAHGRWVSVKDAMPTPLNNVLVHIRHCDPCIAYWYNGSWFAVEPDPAEIRGDGGFFGKFDACYEVTHWMIVTNPLEDEKVG